MLVASVQKLLWCMRLYCLNDKFLFDVNILSTLLYCICNIVLMNPDLYSITPKSDWLHWLASTINLLLVVYFIEPESVHKLFCQRIVSWLLVLDHTSCVLYRISASVMSIICLNPSSKQRVILNIISHIGPQPTTWAGDCPFIGPRVKSSFGIDLNDCWRKRLNAWWWYEVKPDRHWQSVPYPSIMLWFVCLMVLMRIKDVQNLVNLSRT